MSFHISFLGLSVGMSSSLIPTNLTEKLGIALTDLAIAHPITYGAPDRHSSSVRVVVLILEFLAQLCGLDHDVIIFCLPYSFVEIRWEIRLCMRRIRGALNDRVVVNSGVAKDATGGGALIESIGSQRL